MRDKSVARDLLEKFLGGPQGANQLLHSAIEAAILEEELKKRLTKPEHIERREFQNILALAEGAEKREEILYQYLAPLLTRPEMEKVHVRIHTNIKLYQESLAVRKKTPR